MSSYVERVVLGDRGEPAEGGGDELWGSVADISADVVNLDDEGDVDHARPFIRNRVAATELIREAERDTEGASSEFTEEHFRKVIEGDRFQAHVDFLLNKEAEAKRVMEDRTQEAAKLKSVKAFLRGRKNDDIRAISREEEARRALYELDTLDRLAPIRRGFENEDAAIIQAVLDNPLEHILGPLAPAEMLDPIVEEASRSMFPDAWARIDQQMEWAGREHTRATLHLEHLERISGAVLKDPATSGISGS